MNLLQLEQYIAALKTQAPNVKPEYVQVLCSHNGKDFRACKGVQFGLPPVQFTPPTEVEQ